MKKRIITSLLTIALALTLCACADTNESGVNSIVSNPFETSENENGDTSANDDRYELYDKYQSGALQFDFSEMNDAQNIEYNGEKINITFSANAASNREDITIGYMAFIGGIPQVLSVNGSEEAETVSVNFPKDDITNVSINIKPRITKELEDKKELNLQIVSIFNIGYVPQGKYVGFGFGNINAGSTVYTACLTMNEKAETVELSRNAEFENIPASDSSLKSYTLKKAGKMSSGAILKMFSVNNETEYLILDKSTQTCDVLFDGTDFDTYNVFFYVNHKRVQVNGKDYAAVSAKAGYVPKLTAILENVNNHDIVYAIAVPLTNDYTKARILKTTSRLSFSPDDEIITNPATQPPADTSADVPESEPGITDIDRLSDPLFAYTPMGYIDNDMRYLLLYREKNPDAADGYCYIVYNSTDKTISDELYTIDNRCLRTSYGDGYFVILDKVLDDNGKIKEQYVVTYNENLEEINRIAFSDTKLFSAAYIAATDQYCICTEKDGVYTMALYTKDGEQEKVLTSGEWYAQTILSTGDRLAVLERDMNSHEKLEIIDLSGNVICSAAPVKDYNAIRIERAGKLIYMPPNLGYSPLPDEAPNDCVIVYDTESRELSEFRPETAQEAGTLRFTPDGKTAVCITETDITNEDKTDLIGVIDKLYMYDTESGTKIKEIEIDTKSPLYMHRVYEDKVMFYELLTDEATDETRQNVQCFYMIDL